MIPKYFLALLISPSLIFSCSSPEKAQEKPITITTDSLPLESFKDEDYSLDIGSISQSCKLYLGDSIMLRLTDSDLKTRKSFKEVDKGFYNKFIKKNEKVFNQWNLNKNDNSYEVKHYYYGTIQRSDSLSRILIYEYFILNHSEDKLFLLTFDKDANLKSIQNVSELTYYPGAVWDEYSLLHREELTTTKFVEGIEGTDEKTGKDLFTIDSVVTKFKIKNGFNFVQVSKDSVTFQRLK